MKKTIVMVRQFDMNCRERRRARGLTSTALNSGEVRDRSVETLLAWARTKGIVVPDYIGVVPRESGDPPMKNGREVDAKYSVGADVLPNDYIYWDNENEPLQSVVGRQARVVVINVMHEVMQNDERFLHVIAHEVFELAELNGCSTKMVERWAAKGLRARRTHDEQQEYSLGAWEYADDFIERLRGEKP